MPLFARDGDNRPSNHENPEMCRARRAAGVWGLISGVVDKSAPLVESLRTDRTASPSREELVAQQGVTPIDDFETLLGDPRREDESAEEFSASLREWLREGALRTSP